MAHFVLHGKCLTCAHAIGKLLVAGKNMTLRGEKLQVEFFFASLYGTVCFTWKMNNTRTYKRKLQVAGKNYDTKGRKALNRGFFA